jgi:hypothetical protein
MINVISEISDISDILEDIIILEGKRTCVQTGQEMILADDTKHRPQQTAQRQKSDCRQSGGNEIGVEREHFREGTRKGNKNESN